MGFGTVFALAAALGFFARLLLDGLRPFRLPLKLLFRILCSFSSRRFHAFVGPSRPPDQYFSCCNWSDWIFPVLLSPDDGVFPRFGLYLCLGNFGHWRCCDPELHGFILVCWIVHEVQELLRIVLESRPNI